MKGKTNMDGVTEQGVVPELPSGEYVAEITEIKDGLSSNGDPLATIKLNILTPGFNECWVWDNILIPESTSPAAKILGRSKHFLHCIGEPYEGKEVEYDTDNWIHKQVRIKTDVELPNKFHKYPKPIVAQYILDEEMQQGKTVDMGGALKDGDWPEL